MHAFLLTSTTYKWNEYERDEYRNHGIFPTFEEAEECARRIYRPEWSTMDIQEWDGAILLNEFSLSF